MRRHTWWIRVASFVVVAVPLGAAGFKQDSTQNSAQTSASDTRTKDKKADKTNGQSYVANRPTDPSQYVGTDTCKTCHEDIGKTYDRGPHWKTMLDKHHGVEWQGCEACHGPGKEHAESGDITKSISFKKLSRQESSKQC